jgi:Calcineurin-like phosphoesterase
MSSRRNLKISRRQFSKTLLAGAAGLGLPWTLSRAADTPAALSSPKKGAEPFAFPVLGDLHFDRPEHHLMDWLQQEHPGDVHQVKNYCHITKDVHPHLFATVRETIADLNKAGATPVPFVLHVGDFVEGLCGNKKLAVQQDTEAVEFVHAANFGAPFLFTKGNHDITGPGAPDAFQEILNPFMAAQGSAFGVGKLTNALYTVEHNDALFCFFDAYDDQSLDWLEATLARRTARHCFVIVHPPVVPYGARSTWCVFYDMNQHEFSPRRQHLLELLGQHQAIVLGGHIHKYNWLVRATPPPRGGRFVQLGVSSIINRAGAAKAVDVLTGVDEYNGDQIKVEPHFSPSTEEERRGIYKTEAPFIKQFQYANLPGYAVVTVNGGQVTAQMFSGTSRDLWRAVPLTDAI